MKDSSTTQFSELRIQQSSYVGTWIIAYAFIDDRSVVVVLNSLGSPTRGRLSLQASNNSWLCYFSSRFGADQTVKELHIQQRSQMWVLHTL
jgi:hypothetical protein